MPGAIISPSTIESSHFQGYSILAGISDLDLWLANCTLLPLSHVTNLPPEQAPDESTEFQLHFCAV